MGRGRDQAVLEAAAATTTTIIITITTTNPAAEAEAQRAVKTRNIDTG